MKKKITMLLLSAGLSLGAFQATATEVADKSGRVEVIALSAEQASKLTEERVLYQALVNRLMAIEDHSTEQRLQDVREEYQRRVELILHNIEVAEQPTHHHRAPQGVIY